MRIKMLVAMGGIDDASTHRPGDILDVSEATARAWAEADIAVIVDEQEEAPFDPEPSGVEEAIAPAARTRRRATSKAQR